MYDLLIIGAGPAGISMAAEARTAGVDVGKIMVLEKAPEHSFSIKKYYPEGKLVTANYKGFNTVCLGVLCIPDLSKADTISYLDQAIQANQIHVQYEESVYKIHKEPDEQHFVVSTDKGTYETKVIAVAIGILGKPNKPEYKLPHTLKDRLLFDLTTIEVVNANVLVIGGGDSASEYCQFLVQNNDAVTLSYRRAEFSRMNDINRQSLLTMVERNQVKVLYKSTISSVTDEGGKPRVTFAEPEHGIQHYDYVVYALGGTTPKNFLKTIGIEFDGEEPVMTQDHETNVPGLFLTGDLSAGTKGGSIIWAFNASRKAMRKICSDYLECSMDL
ncbi:MAG: NAD(P)-binding domain-containing protein [bacterium]